MRQVGHRSQRVALGLLLLLSACRSVPARPSGPPLVAVVDDGERIGRRDGPLPVLRGQDNPVWAPGRPVRLLGLPGEAVALQVVVSAGAAPLREVTVEVALTGPRPPEAERLVVAELQMTRRSGGKHAGESLGWERGAMPPGPGTPASLPEPLIPVERAPSWADYPMTVAPGEHRVVWIDLLLPESGLSPGRHGGRIIVKGSVGPGAQQQLADLALELEVGPLPLPYAAARTMVYYSPGEIAGRIGPAGAAEAVRSYLQLMHRHHLSPIHRIDSEADVAAQRDELTGALFTQARGYHGPGAGRGADVIAFGIPREP